MKKLIVTDSSFEFVKSIKTTKDGLVKLALVEGLVRHLRYNHELEQKPVQMKLHREIDKILEETKDNITALSLIMRQLTGDFYMTEPLYTKTK